MNPTNRFQQVMAAVLVCALCGAIALFRQREQASAEPGSRRTKADANTKQEAAPEPAKTISTDEAAGATGTRPTAAAEAISQLANSVVTIVKVEPATKELAVANTTIQAGVVIDPRGYVLTPWLDDYEDNDNDAKEKQQLAVRFSNQNQKEYPAEVVENDRLWGLALLKIEAAQPLSAISLKNVREPVSNGAVLLVPSVPRKKPVKGRITSTGIPGAQPSPYLWIGSNIRLPDGEAGSLLVTSRGDPIGIVAGGDSGSSYAIPWKAVLDFIRTDDALQEVLGHLVPNPPPIPTKSVPTSTAPPAKEGRTPTGADVIQSLSPTVVTIRRADESTREPDPNFQRRAGIVVDPRGYILTLLLDDKDVENDDKMFMVHFSNHPDSEYAADAVASDRSWRLALLKVRAEEHFPAISLDRIQQAEYRGAVYIVTSQPQKSPMNGRITSNAVTWNESLPYNFIKANIKLFAGEAGSLMVSDRGDPIGILSNKFLGSEASYAVPLKAVRSFIESAINPDAPTEVQGPFPPPLPDSRGREQSDDELMDSLRIREPGPGVPTPAVPQPAGGPGPAPMSFTPPTAPGRHFRAVTDSPAEQKLIEQLQSRESAAAELAAKIRTLQASGPGERNQSAIADAQRELKSQLSTAFDLKLQLEELQVKELQSRLSRLERQIGQRRALRDKIIERRAAQLVEDNGLQWDTSGRSPKPSPRSVSSARQAPAPAVSPPVSPSVVKKLKRRAGLLVDGMKAGEVKPAAVLAALEELKRIEPPPPAEWLDLLETMLETTEKLHAASMITEAELLQIEAACDEAQSAIDRASLPPKAGDSTPAKAGRDRNRPGWTKVCLSGPKGMHISISGDEEDLGTTATYSIQSPANEVRQIPLLVQYAPGSQVYVNGRLDVYPTNPKNDPEAGEFLQNNPVQFQISEQDTRMVFSGQADVTKVVVMRFVVSLPDKKVENIELETIDSATFPPGTNMIDKIDKALRHGTIVAILTLSQRFAASPDPAPRAGADANTLSNWLKRTADPSEELPPTGKPVSVSRPFPLRFKLASEMVDDLRQILLGREGHEAKPSVDNQEVLVIAPPETMERVQTFITVMDWPDEISRGINFEYPRESVIRAARSFFYACAIEDDAEAFSKLLSLHVLAELKGDTKSENFQKYLFGGTSDPEWEKTLRGDWPGKKEAIRRFVGEWNKYPLKRITEGDGVAIGFGAKYFCSVSFAGAPKEFYQVAIVPDRTGREGDKTLYVFSSLPPWWKSENRADEAKTDDDNDVGSPSAGLKISTEKSRSTLEGKSEEDADLVLRIGQKQYKLNWTNWLRKGREFKAVVELSDKIKPNHDSFGSSLIYRVRVGDTESTSSIRIPTTGPMPSGQLSFREANQVTRKDGVITFADLRSDDGTLVPVSISVEAKR